MVAELCFNKLKQETMNRSAQHLKISAIMYDNMDTNVLIQAISLKEHLSFETEMFVTFSELNFILNELQKRNPETNVSEMFIEERLDERYIQHFLNASLLKNPTILLHQNSFATNKKQIRA